MTLQLQVIIKKSITRDTKNHLDVAFLCRVTVDKIHLNYLLRNQPDINQYTIELLIGKRNYYERSTAWSDCMTQYINNTAIIT